MANIINLTQHLVTDDQAAAGIVNVQENLRSTLSAALTFPAVYTKADLESHAGRVYGTLLDHLGADKCDGVMIGGMPSFMPVLEKYLQSKGVRVGYACTDRVSVDVPDGKGGVTKTSVFKHVGMYWA